MHFENKYIYLFLFRNRISLYRPGWGWIYNPPAWPPSAVCYDAWLRKFVLNRCHRKCMLSCSICCPLLPQQHDPGTKTAVLWDNAYSDAHTGPSLCAHDAGIWLCNFYFEVGITHADQPWYFLWPISQHSQSLGILPTLCMDKGEPGFWEMKATGKDSKGPTGSLEPSLRPHLPERDPLKDGIRKAAGLSPAEVANQQSLPPHQVKLYCGLRCLFVTQ